jgi:integrase
VPWEAFTQIAAKNRASAQQAEAALNAVGKKVPVAVTPSWHSRIGTTLLASNVRRPFRLVLRQAALDESAWMPRELRHSFVSLMSDSGVRIGDIAELCGHAGTRVTEAVYRHQLRPVILNGAEAMDRIFAPLERADGELDAQIDPQRRKDARPESDHGV